MENELDFKSLANFEVKIMFFDKFFYMLDR